MTRIIAIVNEKGGVGKTTSTINIGAGLARMKRKVLLVDLDPQCSLSKSLSISKGSIEKTLFTVFTEETKITEIISRKENYDIVPAYGISGADIKLSTVPGKDYLLKESLSPVLDHYDYILIDCPPSLGTLTINALICASEVFVTLQTEYLALEGITELIRTIDVVKKRLNNSLIMSGVICTLFDGRIKIHREVVEKTKEYFKEKVFETMIRRNINLSEAPANGMDIFEYMPESNGAMDYAALCKEIAKGENKVK